MVLLGEVVIDSGFQQGVGWQIVDGTIHFSSGGTSFVTKNAPFIAYWSVLRDTII